MQQSWAIDHGRSIDCFSILLLTPKGEDIVLANGKGVFRAVTTQRTPLDSGVMRDPVRFAHNRRWIDLLREEYRFLGMESQSPFSKDLLL